MPRAPPTYWNEIGAIRPFWLNVSQIEEAINGNVAPRIKCGLQSLQVSRQEATVKDLRRNQAHTLFMGYGKGEGG